MNRLLNKRIARLADEGGFTIIEVMVAIFILLIGVLATVTLLNTANASTERNQARNGATNLVRDIIEAARALPYDKTTATVNSTGAPDSTFQTALQSMSPTTGGSSFADSDPATPGWQITRRGIRYTVTIAACVVDDAKDGVASSHTPAAANGTGYWCPNLPTTPTGDSNGDDYRRVVVRAAWTNSTCNSCSTPGQSAGQSVYSVAQTAVIINPTGGLGPSPSGPIQSPSSVCPAARTLTATFADTATGAVFTVNDPAATQVTVNTPSSTDTVAKTVTFTFSYAPSPAPADNTYLVTAQAFNASGQFGRPVVASLPVNCAEPAGPTGLTGGFNWRRCIAYPATCNNGERIFELEWAPNSEADVIAYYVYRVNGFADWKNQAGDTGPDTLISCVGRAGATSHPGPTDFFETFQPACWDAGVAGQPSLGNTAGLVNFAGAVGSYWVRAVDPDPSDPTGATLRAVLTNHSGIYTVTENMLNVRPTPPVLAITNVNGSPCLSWTDSLDADALGTNLGAGAIRFYRIYRDANVVSLVSNGQGGQVFDVPYADRIGRAQPNQPNSCDTANPGRSFYLDQSAGTSTWSYWVTAVDQNYLESFPSPIGSWTPPAGG